MSIHKEKSKWKVIGKKGGTKVSGKCIQGKKRWAPCPYISF